jgi:long-chain acyl-CoA synthetase
MYQVSSSVTLGDVLREHARSRGALQALVDHDVRLTYRDLDQRVNKLADVLGHRYGVSAGDRVLWLGQNSFRLIEILGAVAKLGAALVPANWRQAPSEVAFIIGDVEPKVVFWQDEEIGDTIRAARSLSEGGPAWIQHDGTGEDSYEAVIAEGSTEDPDVTVDPSSSVLGIYTAAFGGQPNAAMLSHWAVLLEGLLVGRISEISDATVFLNSGPMFHLGTMMTTLATLVHGGANVIVARVDPEELCTTIESEGCTRAFIMAPTLEDIRAINADGRWDLSILWGSNDPADWTMCTPSANPTTRRAGGYGQSEVSGLITSYGLGRQTESIYGRPLPLNQVRLVTVDGSEATDGEIGEIVCRGPLVMNEYLKRDGLNAERQRDGWHYTGDLGRREPDGSIGFVGPKMRMIKSASENIYPVEIERCLLSHPAVAEVCVIGVPDERWTQSVKALIVLDEGATASSEELIEHCRAHIASYKKPRTVEFVTALPKTKAGQVDREQADAEYGGGGYPGQVSSGARAVPMKS